MHVTQPSTGTIQITLTLEEAADVRDDIGQLWASQISTAGDQLHTLLVDVTEEGLEGHAPSYANYLAHRKRGEDACDGCLEAKRVYDRERYAKNPRRARAPQRAYEARQRAARKAAAA